MEFGRYLETQIALFMAILWQFGVRFYGTMFLSPKKTQLVFWYFVNKLHRNKKWLFWKKKNRFVKSIAFPL